MKLTKDDIKILKNFSEINESIELRRGKVLKTIHKNKTILTEAQLSQDLPQDFVISDLHTFLNVVSLYDDPEFDFEETKLKISEGNRRVEYIGSERTNIILPPENDFTLPDPEFVFALEEAELKNLLRTAAVLGLNQVAITPKDGKIILRVHDRLNANKNTFEIETATPADGTFNANIKIDNLKLLEGSYDVSVTKQVAKFIHKDKPVKYWITVEKTSTFA